MSKLSVGLRRVAVISLKAFSFLIGILAMIYVVGIYVAAQSNSTRKGPLPSDQSNPVLSSAHELLSGLPDLGELSDDSLRFAAMPSFGRRWFGITLSSNGKDIRGSAVILDRETGTKSTKAFSIPPTVYVRMISEFDGQIDGYWGEARGWTDGTPLAFERKRDERIVSGVGNSPCHYAVITNVLARNLYVPEVAELIEPEAESYSQSEYCDAF